METSRTARPKARSTFVLAILWLTVLVPLAAPFVAIALLWGHWATWRDVGLLVGMYVACGLGITVGYHRMLTHRAFKPTPVVKFVFLALGTMSAMGPALRWAVTHIQHHAHPDEEGDPHSPWDWLGDRPQMRVTGWKSFLRAHFLWIVYGDEAQITRYGQELQKDPMVRFMSAWPVVIALIAAGFAIPYLVGGLQGMLWGGIVRIGLTHHITWSINSICHIYGRRMFETPDCSRNNWVFALLGFGEGWHNNHHAFPRSAFHGLRWWQVDLSGYLIWAMARLRLVSEVWTVPQTTLAARAAGSSNPRSPMGAERR